METTLDKDPMDLSTRSLTSPADGGVASPYTGSAQPMPHNPEMEMVNFPCHTCGEMFLSRSQQEQHISDRHSRSKIDYYVLWLPPFFMAKCKFCTNLLIALYVSHHRCLSAQSLIAAWQTNLDPIGRFLFSF